MTCLVGLAGCAPASRKTAHRCDRRQVSVSIGSRGEEACGCPLACGTTPNARPSPRSQRRHGSCHSHGRPRSDAPRIGIRSDGRGRSPGSRVRALSPPSRRHVAVSGNWRRARRSQLRGQPRHRLDGKSRLASPAFPFHPSSDGTTSRVRECAETARRVNGRSGIPSILILTVML